MDKSSAGEVENVPILSTSVAYGVYMAVSSNLRYIDLLDMVLLYFLSSIVLFMYFLGCCNCYCLIRALFI